MTTRITRIAMILLVAALVAALFALQGCSTDADSDSGDRAAEETAETANEGSDESAEEGAEDPPAPVIPEEPPVFEPTYVPNGSEIAVINTPKGTIKFEFYADDAPNHVASFIELATSGFYDGTKFHRVEPNFVIQGGDPLSKTDDPMVGTGGPGYNVPAEFNQKQHLEGTVAMARSTNPDSAGSQFYICLSPQPGLDGQYTVFGQVTEGLDIVQQIAIGDVMESVVIENVTE